MFSSSNIEKFINRFRQVYFYHQDGFYNLPYLANSPQITIDSLKAMPFVKMFPEANLMSTSNPFFEGEFHFEELEKDLWIIVSDIKFKKNVNYNLIYNKALPIKYYNLSFYLNKSKRKLQQTLINNNINIDRTWMLFKPGSEAVNSNFAGSESVLITISFSEDWLEKNSKLNGLFASGELKDWLDSDDDFLLIPELFDESDCQTSKPILDIILNKGDKGVQDILQLRIKTLELISSFIQRIKETRDESLPYFASSNQNRVKILKAEKILSDAVFECFPGIKEVATEVGVSPTKLKNNFKAIYGLSLFKYYQYKQMEVAKSMLLKNPSLKITYIANVLGYINVSKFSAAFKSCFGYLPSQVNNKNY